jgi:aconitate hydratase 2/2-methylisocitrate dehydratase
MGVLKTNGDKIYKYMNFDQIEQYQDTAREVAV